MAKSSIYILKIEGQTFFIRAVTKLQAVKYVTDNMTVVSVVEAGVDDGPTAGAAPGVPVAARTRSAKAVAGSLGYHNLTEGIVGE